MENDNVFCPVCGKENAATERVCRNCGVKITSQYERATIDRSETAAKISSKNTTNYKWLIWILIPIILFVVYNFYERRQFEIMSLGLGGREGAFAVTELGSLQTAEWAYHKKYKKYADFETLEKARLVASVFGNVVNKTRYETKDAVFDLKLFDGNAGYEITLRMKKNGKVMTVTHESENVLDVIARRAGVSK